MLRLWVPVCLLLLQETAANVFLVHDYQRQNFGALGSSGETNNSWQARYAAVPAAASCTVGTRLGCIFTPSGWAGLTVAVGKEQGLSSAGPLVGMHSAGSTLATIPVPILPVN